MEQGWIKLFRSLTDNSIWRCEPFTRGQAWVDLLLLANFDRSYFFKRGVKIIVERGQVARSEVELADRWKWSRTKVRKFLNDLEKEQQIEQHKTNVNKLITIINYNLYQGKEQQIEQQKDNKRTAEEHQKNTLKEIKEIKEYKGMFLSEIKISDFPELSHEYFEVAKAFKELFKANLTEAGASTATIDKAKGTWIDDVRLIIETDKYTMQDLRQVFTYLKNEIPDNNGFAWKSNILSISKLRKQMPKLKLKIHNGTTVRPNRKEGTSWDELAQIVHGAFNN